MFKENVVITGECFNLFKDIICDYECRVDNDIEGHTYNATITSANDGVHSNNSTHYKNKAIDLRIKDIDLGRDYLKKYMEAIVMYLGDIYRDFVFILHLYDGKNHIHIQHGRDNIISFDSAICENKNVFIK